MTLQTKITLLITTTVIVICTFSLMITDRVMRNAFDSELTDKGVVLVEALAESIGKQVIDNNVLEVTEVLNKIVSRSKNLEYAYVIGLDGRLFAHTFRKGFPKKLLGVWHNDQREFPAIEKYLLRDKAVFEVAYPLIEGLRAHVHIGMDESFQQERYVLLSRQIFYLSTVVIILGILLSFLISRRIVKPMKRLTEYLNDFGRGVLEETIEINGSAPEVSQLSKSFNNMVVCRKEAEQKLRKSEEKFRGLFNDALDMIHIADKYWNIINANPIELQTLGYTREEYIGKPLLDISHPDYKEHTRIALAEVFRGNNVKNYETVLVTKNGDRVDVEVSAVPLIEDGNVVSIRAIIRDITERKRAGKEIFKAKEEWERTFQSIGDIATIQDVDLRIIRVNRQTCETLAMQPEELLGKFCHEVFRGESHPCEGCPVILAVKDREIHTAEIEHKRLEKIFQVTASPVLGEDGQLANVVYLAKDITEQKNLENRLRQAQKMEAIGTLAGGIAHDFNNILAPILGYADMALDNIPAGSQTAYEIKAVLEAANRAKELVKQILSFSRHAEQELQPLKIQLVIKEALKLLRASIPTTIEIRQDINMECGPVLADPTQIHQIIMNLCTNAYHAMRKKGGVLGVLLAAIELDSEDLKTKIDLRPGKYIVLEVSDTGHGMGQVVMEKVFEPYFTTKGKGEGTGLGLSVVHGIIRSLNGDITVYSELKKGTTFHVYFPAIVQEVEKMTDKETAEALQTGNERILVVDDDEIIVEMEQLMLDSLGYDVTAFTNSEECLESFQSRPNDFDLIITDMTMPKMTGEIFAKQVLKIRPGMPIILCTGFSELISGEKAKAFGIKEFIMKPIIKRDLAKVVRKVLDGEISPG